jgi:hypothetical protein
VTEAAQVAAKYSREFISGNDANQLKEMAAKGAKINAKPDVAAFRAAVQPVYAKAREKYGADVDRVPEGRRGRAQGRQVGDHGCVAQPGGAGAAAHPPDRPHGRLDGDRHRCRDGHCWCSSTSACT